VPDSNVRFENNVTWVGSKGVVNSACAISLDDVVPGPIRAVRETVPDTVDPPTSRAEIVTSVYEVRALQELARLTAPSLGVLIIP
jgi:hypothetical protein